MANPSLRQGPLDHLGLAARQTSDRDSGVLLKQMPFRSIVELRGTWSESFVSAVERAAGVVLPKISPEAVQNEFVTCFWMGPDRWWLLRDESATPSVGELRQTLASFSAAAVEIGDSFVALQISGPRAADVLAKGCTIDLHPRAFQAEQIVQTNLAKTQIALHQTGESAYQVFTRRSFGEYLWTWLEDAGLEYGVTIEID